MGLDGVVVRSTVNGLVTGRVYVGSVSLSYRRSGLLRSNTGLFSLPICILMTIIWLNDMCCDEVDLSVFVRLLAEFQGQ
jgi:hypothetical protein